MTTIAARFIYVTTSGREEALRIGRTLVEKRIVACVNVLDGMTSLYHWQGALETGQEAILIAKTTEDRTAEAVETIRTLHSYDCPCVLVLPIVTGNDAFLRWIEAETHPM